MLTMNYRTNISYVQYRKWHCTVLVIQNVYYSETKRSFVSNSFSKPSQDHNVFKFFSNMADNVKCSHFNKFTLKVQHAWLRAAMTSYLEIQERLPQINYISITSHCESTCQLGRHHQLPVCASLTLKITTTKSEVDSAITFSLITPWTPSMTEQWRHVHGWVHTLTHAHAGGQGKIKEPHAVPKQATKSNWRHSNGMPENWQIGKHLSMLDSLPETLET